MKETILSIFFAMIYIVGFADYGVGVYHSFKKHGTADGLIGTVLFPWAMYRGVEIFWHDDYANVDWNKRLDSDLRTSIYFLTEGTYKNANLYELNDNLEEFSSKIKEYPTEKKKYLLEGCREYISYSISLTKDVTKLINKFYSTGKFDNSLNSPETIKRKTALINTYKLNDLIEPLEQAMNEQLKLFSSQPESNLTQAEIEDMKTKFSSQMEIYLTKTETDMNRIFKTLFNVQF